MNAFPGLTWEFSERAKTIDFMDMMISINKSNCIETTLFEKRLNLHLSTPPPPPPPPPPPHSAHPPGLLPGIVYGTLFRIFTLCSNNEDKLQRTKVFFKRLIARGYKGNEIRPLFHKAITRAKAYSGPTQDEDDDHNSVIPHLPFHPNDPASSRIQAEWRTHVTKTSMETAPGTHEKHQNKREMQHQTDDYCIQTPNESR